MANALSAVAVLCLIAAFGSLVSASSCPNISTTAGYTCDTSLNCTRLECMVSAGSQIVTATASITLDSCDDPPLVHMQAHGVFVNQTVFVFSHSFRESGSVYDGNTTVSAAVQRNETFLQFSALLEGSPPQYLIPPVEYAINTTECLCSSMKDLASDINTPFEHDCSTTPDCDGVVCHVDILIRSYIMVMYILSCEDPPAVAVALGDPQGNVVWTYYINDNSTTLTIIDGFPVVVVSYIVHHTYSMDIEVHIILPISGIVSIIPPRTIILDSSQCHTPPTATPTATPLPPTLPPSAPEPCVALYNIANTARDPLVCRVISSCTSLLCELTSVNDIYEIDVRLLMKESDIKTYVTFTPLQSSDSVLWIVSTNNETRQFILNSQGSSLVIVMNTTYDILTLQMLLRDANQQDSLLMPSASISLPSGGSCLWWVPVIANYRSCSYLPDCQGILCLTLAGHIDTTSVSLERCGDPIAIKMVLSVQNSVLFEGNFTESGQFEYGFVDIQRSDTWLIFSATALSGDVAYVLVPDMTIHLDPHACSCQSLEELAEKTHSPLEHDCRTNEECDGVRCVLDVFGTTYHLETILLSCEEPPALESVVENENNVPLHTAIYNETGLYMLQISGTTLPLYVVIEHHDYSMDIAGYLTIPFFGNTTIVPPHTLFLDPTSCRSPPTVPPTSPPTVSPTCQALLNIQRKTTEESFMCTAIFPTTGGTKDDCNTLECRLVVRTSSYVITLELHRLREENVASVTVTLGTNTLKDVDVNGTQQFSVALQKGELLFDFKSQGKALRMQIMLAEGGTTTTLINSTVLLQDNDEGTTSPSSEGTTSPSSHKSNNKAPKIAAAVVIVGTVCVVAAVVVVLLSVSLLRKRQTQRQFDFKPMRYSDIQSENLGDGNADEKEVEEDGNDSEKGNTDNDDGNHYEPVDIIH